MHTYKCNAESTFFRNSRSKLVRRNEFKPLRRNPKPKTESARSIAATSTNVLLRLRIMQRIRRPAIVVHAQRMPPLATNTIGIADAAGASGVGSVGG